MSDEHAKTKEEILKELRTSENGLTSEEADARLQKYGKNILKEPSKIRPIKIFLEQFNSFLIYILVIAAGISFLIKHNLDGIVISVVVLVNAGIGFTQQYKAEKAIADLKKFLVSKSKVLRNGRLLEISSEEIVPGDILVLSAGDKINADCRILESENLQTNEAILTGESMPVSKFSKVLNFKIPLSQRSNILFAGTQISRGSAKAIVISIGMNTSFGKIAKTLESIETQETPVQKKLDKFSRQIGIIILVLVAGVMVLGLTKHFDLMQMFLTSVALAVAAIPAGLPAVLAISFAISSNILAKRNVIVRRLPAVESLGSVTVICSDKTGTITEEKMAIQKIFANNRLYSFQNKNLFLNNKKINLEGHKELSHLLKTSILCNNARFEKIGEGNYELIGDSTENALLSTALDLGLNKKTLIESEPSLRKFEFDSSRKMMSVLRKTKNGKILYSKGAPEKILNLSSFELVQGKIRKLTEKRREEIRKVLTGMESDALRTLGFAFKKISSEKDVSENNLVFLGFEGMIDPPRKEVKFAVEECIRAGINVKMITGDSAITAFAIAEQIGIKGKLVTSEQLEKMSDDELSKSLSEIAIFARATPHQKLRIIKLLQQNSEIVAVTGDGVNDVLALKSADVGVAMGKRGTDVARDVSDIVLVDDNFASLVEGVKQGRKTYDNIKKFTKYFLAVNFSEIFLIIITLAFMLPLPLLPLHLLWMNLITDAFPALALAFEKSEDVMNSKPRTEKNLLHGIWKFIIFAGVIALLAELVIFLIGLKQNLPIEEIRTIVLTTGIFFELSFVYACRSDKSVFKKGFFSNKWVNYAVLFAGALHVALIYTPLAGIFGLVPLTLKNWIFLLPFAVSGLVILECWKFIKSKFSQSKKE